ncbi:conserved Plasmodium membrane protein, unknown function [Plasmodium relictum]|uniref:Uncharacterized protein n=1 Tax=Plasmodium relictum TaxID=85471 RepID=A0A1J1H8A2_PLARL|nr:conserved Plasmodium membrane protein, unknown function [Plasmodium relictum]CRH01200.1 conserved Plasmodium membrane protein, unknown function [Plasmodium relictum]
MKLKGKIFNIGLLLLIIFIYIKKCKGYILNINVVDKDDLFIFLYKNEHLLASSYYNFKPSYFFSFDEGEISIDLKIDFKENKIVKKRNKNQEVLAKANKNSINILNNFNVDKEYFNKQRSYNIYNDEEINTSKSKGENSLSNYKLDNSNNNIKSNEKDINDSYKSNNIYLVLITANQWINYIRLKNKLEPSLKNEENYIFTSHFNCIKRYPLNKGRIQKIIKINQKNRYMLFLINNNKLKISLKGNVIFYDYKTKHLSHDFHLIPNVLLITSYLLLILVLFITIYYIKYRTKSDIFMILNMLFFLLSTYFNYKNGFSKYLKENSRSNFIYYLFASFFRSHLSRIEIQFMICFSVISFYTGLFEIFLGNFQAPRYILQAFAYLFIFIAINFTSTFLSARLSEENLSFHVAELYKKYDIYKKYRLIFFAVILKPILLVIYKVLCLSPSNIDLYSSHEFFYVFFDITFDIILYVMLFVLFRPAKPIKLLKHILSNENFHID